MLACAEVMSTLPTLFLSHGSPMFAIEAGVAPPRVGGARAFAAAAARRADRIGTLGNLGADAYRQSQAGDHA